MTQQEHLTVAVMITTAAVATFFRRLVRFAPPAPSKRQRQLAEAHEAYADLVAEDNHLRSKEIADEIIRIVKRASF